MKSDPRYRDTYFEAWNLKIENAENVVATNKSLGDYKVELYETQRQETIALTCLAFVLVGAAILFSALQIWLDFKRNRSDVSSLEITASGLRLSSSVIGLFVLVAAMLFMKMYIEDVYPIHEAIQAHK